MVYGFISPSGVGKLVKIDGITNSEKYDHICIHHLGSIRLTTASIFNMTMIPNTLQYSTSIPGQKNTQHLSWTGLPRALTSTALLKQCEIGYMDVSGNLLKKKREKKVHSSK